MFSSCQAFRAGAWKSKPEVSLSSLLSPGETAAHSTPEPWGLITDKYHIDISYHIQGEDTLGCNRSLCACPSRGQVSPSPAGRMLPTASRTGTAPVGYPSICSITWRSFLFQTWGLFDFSQAPCAAAESRSTSLDQQNHSLWVAESTRRWLGATEEKPHAWAEAGSPAHPQNCWPSSTSLQRQGFGT